MVVAILTFTGSTEEITSGIPVSMTIATNIPATIFFTLDETVPTTDSPIYIDTFAMPENQTSVTLSAFGLDSDGYSGPILTQIFAANQTRIDRTRHVGLEGVVVDRFADPLNITVGFDADGTASAFSDITDVDLRVLHSAQGRFGIAEGTVIEIGTPLPSETPSPIDDNFQTSSSPSDEIFNPFARTIVVDYRKTNVVKILNRPYGSIRNLSRDSWGQNELREDSTYISGGFIKRFYSAKTNTMGSYYFDQNTYRWVIGLQALPTSVPNIGGFNQTGQPLVFQWIARGRHSTIPI